MNVFFRLCCLVSCLFLCISCSNEQSAQEKSAPVAATQSGTAQATPQPVIPQRPLFRSIPPKEAQTLMAQRKDLILIDVRNPGEMREGYIAGSRLVPIGELARGKMTLPSDKPLLLICAVGGRSYAVGQYFYRKGYPEIYNLKGGIDAWKRAGLPLKHL